MLAHLRLSNAEDAERLLSLATGNGAAGRQELFRSLCSLFEESGADFTARERALMRDILERLSHDVEMTLRVELATRLAQREDAPRELILLLANDAIDVARPVLLESRLLDDGDLVELVFHRTMQHRMAIAARYGISAPVSQALIDRGEDDVVAELVGNESATISAAALEHLVAESRRLARLQQPLLDRPDLPQPLARRMYLWVSAELRAAIVEKYQIPAGELDRMVSDSLAAAIGRDVQARAADPAEKLIDKLHAAGQLTLAFVVKSLRQGQMPLFEQALARLLDLPVETVRRAVYGNDGSELALVCRAAGFDRAVFATICQLSRQARGDAPPLANERLDDLKLAFDRMDPEAALATLRGRIETVPA